MSRVLLFIVGLLVAAVIGMKLVSSSGTSGNAPIAVDRGDRADSSAGFAVVELFTSEGCSSCPPADALLNSIAADAAATGKPIYAMAFHVDYWNRLGWKDRFSSSEYSDRQRKYGRALDTRSIYTPQMIVNGLTEFVGSDRGKAESAIAEGLAHTAEGRVKISSVVVSAGSVRIGCVVTGVRGEATLNLALVEKGLSTDVGSGENSGRKLKHDNVVRAFTTIRLEGAGELSGDLTLPKDAVPERCEVIAFIQRSNSMEIVAADRAAVK